MRTMTMLASSVLGLMLATGTLGCEGAEGPAGPAGQDGANGADGKDGENGTNGTNGANGTDGADGKDGKDAVLDPSLSPIDKAFTFLGGKDAIANLTAIAVKSTGSRWVVGEGYLPDDAPLATGTFELDAQHDIKNDKLRLDYKRDINFLGIPAMTTFSAIMSGQLGYVSGSESIFGAPEVGNMPSDRWGANRRQHRLLNPHLVLHDAAVDASLVKDAGAAVLDGILYHVVEIEDDVAPIHLYVSSATGRIAKLTTLENSYFLRDVEVEVFFEGWTFNAAKIAYPGSVYLSYDGHIVHQDARVSLDTAPTFAANLFDFPAGAAPMYDAAAAQRGAESHQFHEMFEAAGLPLDGPQNLTNPIPIAQNIVQLQGGLHNVGLVVQGNGIVMLDAPIHEERSKAVLAYVAANYPGKKITHVVVTHHHEDHSGGVREIAATGAKVVVGQATADLFRRALRARATVRPDALSAAGIEVPVIEVPTGGSYTIPDPTYPVVAYHVDTAHSADMLMMYMPQSQTLWTTDIYGAQTPPGVLPIFLPAAKELYSSIVNFHKITVAQIFSGHGAGTNTFAQFQQAIGM